MEDGDAFAWGFLISIIATPLIILYFWFPAWFQGLMSFTGAAGEFVMWLVVDVGGPLLVALAIFFGIWIVVAMTLSEGVERFTTRMKQWL